MTSRWSQHRQWGHDLQKVKGSKPSRSIGDDVRKNQVGVSDLWEHVGIPVFQVNWSLMATLQLRHYLPSAASRREKSHKLTFKIFILFYLTGISLLLLVVHFEESSCSNWSLKSGNVRVREKRTDWLPSPSLISKILWDEAFSWTSWLMWFAPAGRAAKLPRNVTSGISHRNEPQTAGRELWATGKPWNTRYARDFPTAGLPNWKPEYGGIKKAPSRVESVDFYCNLYGTKVCNMFSGSLWHEDQVVQSGKGDWKGHFS